MAGENDERMREKEREREGFIDSQNVHRYILEDVLPGV